MNKDIKECNIIGIIALTIIIVYSIFMSFQVTYWKHQNIAYEQYRKEDLRQARIYNSTFVNTEEQLLEKIKNMPETDKNIAKAVYSKKPEVNEIKKKIANERLQIKENQKLLKEKNEEKEKLNGEIESIKKKLSQKHNILGDTRVSLSSKGISTIEQYVLTYNINGYISSKEYEHLYDMFVENGNFYEIREFTNVTNKYKIGIKDGPNTYSSLLDSLLYMIGKLSNIETEITDICNEIDKHNSTIETYKLELKPIKEELNELIKENSAHLEYQDTIITNGLKTAGDYLVSV